MVQAFYDRWSQSFVDAYGTTLQAGLLKPAPGAPEAPGESTRQLARLAGLQPGERVLDAGCGVGGPAVVLTEAIDGLRVDGVTVSTVQARLAAGLFEASWAAARLSVTVADFHRLPFPDGAFDVALLFEVIAYSPDLPLLASELARVVRPGGRVYVKDLFQPDGLDAEARARVAAFDELWAQAHTPTLDEASTAFARAGLAVVRAAGLQGVGDERFLGAMFELDAGVGVRLTTLGEHFLAGSSGLPLRFCELLAQRV